MTDYKHMLDEALEWAGYFAWFDDLFLLSLRDKYEKYGSFTEGQARALTNIHSMLKRHYNEV